MSLRHTPDDTPLEVIENLIPVFQKYALNKGKSIRCPKCNSKHVSYSYKKERYVCKICGMEFIRGIKE